MSCRSRPHQDGLMLTTAGLRFGVEDISETSRTKMRRSVFLADSWSFHSPFWQAMEWFEPIKYVSTVSCILSLWRFDSTWNIYGHGFIGIAVVLFQKKAFIVAARKREHPRKSISILLHLFPCKWQQHNISVLFGGVLVRNKTTTDRWVYKPWPKTTGKPFGTPFISSSPFTQVLKLGIRKETNQTWDSNNFSIDFFCGRSGEGWPQPPWSFFGCCSDGWRCSISWTPSAGRCNDQAMQAAAIDHLHDEMLAA